MKIIKANIYKAISKVKRKKAELPLKLGKPSYLVTAYSVKCEKSHNFKKIILMKTFEMSYKSLFLCRRNLKEKMLSVNANSMLMELECKLMLLLHFILCKIHKLKS